MLNFILRQFILSSFFEYVSIATGPSGILRTISAKILASKLGFEFVGIKKSSYFKDDEILVSKEYHGNKELFLNGNNSVKKNR